MPIFTGFLLQQPALAHVKMEGVAPHRTLVPVFSDGQGCSVKRVQILFNITILIILNSN